MPSLLDEAITFRRLEILLAFLEAGNLARAAERLEVSTVTVHRALHSLEAGVRCSLFRHEGRNLLPTDAAHALADVAQEVLRKMHEGVRATREIAGYAADRIRIGSLYSLTSGTVPKLIEPAPGCRFAARCGLMQPSCLAATPPLREIVPGHKVACFLAEAT